MQALHDHDDCRPIRIVQAGRKCFPERKVNSLAISIRIGIVNRHRVAEDHEVGPLAGHALERNPLPEAGRGVLELGFGVLIRREGDLIAPATLEPSPLDQPAAFQRIAYGVCSLCEVARKRLDGHSIGPHTHAGKNTHVSRLFIVPGGILPRSCVSSPCPCSDQNTSSR